MAALKRSRTNFILITLSALVLTFFLNDIRVSYSVLYALAMLFLISSVSMAVGRGRVSAWSEVSRSVVVKNEEFTYTVHIENRSPFHYFQLRPRDLCRDIRFFKSPVSDTGTEIGSFSPRPFSIVSTSVTASFPYRGVYKLGISDVSFVDFLGLFRLETKQKSREGMRVVVLPRIDAKFTLPLQRTPQDLAPRSTDFLSQPSPEISDLRKYVPSDELKKVHWKLSAKRGELIVKEYLPDTITLVRVFLDTADIGIEGEERHELEDNMTGYAASALNFCVNTMVPAELFLGRGSSGRLMVDKPQALTQAVRILAGIRFNASGSELSSFLKTLSSGESTAELVLLLSGMNDLSYDEITKALSLGNHIIIYYFLARDEELPSRTAVWLDCIDRLGGDVHLISPEGVRI